MKRMTELDKRIGLQIRHYRNLRGFSQKVLGRKIGVSYQQIQKYEKGRNRVSSSVLFEIATHLGLKIETFFDEIKEKPVENRYSLLKACANLPEEQIEVIIQLAKQLTRRNDEN